jgi:hypothetical protein
MIIHFPEASNSLQPWLGERQTIEVFGAHEIRTYTVFFLSLKILSYEKSFHATT